MSNIMIMFCVGCVRLQKIFFLLVDMFSLVHVCWFCLENILFFLEDHLKLRLKHTFYGIVYFLELAFLNEKKGCV